VGRRDLGPPQNRLAVTMRDRIVALVDCNNFYVSCQRAFHASLQKKPVIVLSNNDGCVIARSNEVKALGIKMGQPFFECRDLIEKHHIHVFSSNYSLYADMSDRVMKVLAEFAPRLEIYSIDEAFLDLTSLSLADLTAYGHEIRVRVLQLTGIPVSVGIARTKTLAKLANEIVKKQPLYVGVLDLSGLSAQDIDTHLEALPVEDVWGIGAHYGHFLRSEGIFTAKELKNADETWIRKHLTVVGQRTVLELRGIACIPLEPELQAKKGIMCAKTFGREITSQEELEEAVANYTARAAEKLRSQHSLASCISVFIQTNRFKKGIPQHSANLSRHLQFPTAFTPDLIKQALEAVRAIYRPGHGYRKAGVYLSKIVPDENVQPDLFGGFSLSVHYKQMRLMSIVDVINKVYGRDTLFFAAQGIARPWKMRQERRSLRYTTKWSELLSVT
jgi:DNA polymerase V